MIESRIRRLSERFEIGRLTVALALLALVVAVLVRAPAWLVVVLQAGFIGGFTNTIAIYMLFTANPLLPGSGVLIKRKDAIIESLAETMEEHILNPSLIEERVRQVSRSVDPERIISGLNAIVDELRGDMIAFVKAEEQTRLIGEAVKQEGGFWGDMADAVGIVTYGDVAERITSGLVAQIEDFRLDKGMLDAATAHVGTFEEFLLEPDNALVTRHYGSELSIAQLVFEKLDARQLVIDKLAGYEAEQIRDIVSRNIKEHLAWLEVFGVILGMLIAGVVLLVSQTLGI